MDKICKECQATFYSEKSLHGHLKSHKLSMENYYKKYFPKFDLLDQKPIEFKNAEQYFETDFNSKENMKLWIQHADQQKVKNYCKELLIGRKKSKDLIYSPTQVELRTLNYPSIITYNKLFDDYYKICEEIGFKNKFINEWPKDIKITPLETISDTREKKLLNIGPTTVQKLDYGDYALKESSKNHNIFIEKKSLADLISTISMESERFDREIKLAAQHGAYIVVLVLENLSSFMNFKDCKSVSSKIKSTPDFIGYKIRNLIQENPNCQFLFVNGQEEGERIAKLLLWGNYDWRKVDLQFLYDLNNL